MEKVRIESQEMLQEAKLMDRYFAKLPNNGEVAYKYKTLNKLQSLNLNDENSN
jgi:hypothetical protein